MKRNLLRWLAGTAVLLVLLGHVAGSYRLLAVDVLDNLIYDARLRLTMQGTPDDRIVIVDIDERSLAEVGRWPWGRDRMATLVDRLFGAGAKVVGFDIVMAEPDGSSGLVSLDRLAAGALRDDARYAAVLSGLRGQLDFDARFAAALAGRPVVLGYYMNGRGEAHGALPAPVLPAIEFAGHRGGLREAEGYGGNLPVFQRAAAGAGFFNPVVDFDGNVRRVPLLIQHGTGVYESLALAVVRRMLGNPAVAPGFGERGENGDDPLETLELKGPNGRNGALRIPVDEHGAALVPYRGRDHSFPYVSAADVLAGRVPHAQLDGSVVLVGTTAPGLLDMRSTPVGSVYPGVEIHANLVSGMLDGTLKHELGYADAIQVVAMAVISLVMICVLPWQAPLRATAGSIALLALALAGDFALWRYGNAVLPVAATVMLIAALFVLNMSLGFFVESRHRRQFANLFGQYVPPELVEEMSREPNRYSMNGRRAELTVLFSDVRGFTTIAESLEPEELARWMNEYLGAMTSVIRAQRGTLDKYIGDAIMAFWGAPVADGQHAQHAVLAALRMREALAPLNAALAQRGKPAIRIGIGINTGPMTVGDMGSDVRRAYTVMGDAVNLGARLEGISKHYGVDIVAGETTREHTEGIVWRELDRVRVKGKREAVAIYEPVAEADKMSAVEAAELERWHEALRRYRSGDWDAAEALLLVLASAAPASDLYALYLERLATMRERMSLETWDGVYEFDTK
ncbi:adenylate/guanylate cyclase domain-containing protein [Trinickia violacea]|uniref:Adenylate/guanylate cyclase domain-containing protein n=1 Tax=Trinickia violacea TaxID=2571746 RepID=A0A4P8ISQ3_9BURK|nr:adenylate/guanylate cyclase domain-containing protein [Trinickia violacea]QCP52092.1 adenylate/guanylate cyclase domain-containing protein [Trinickia violacea]